MDESDEEETNSSSSDEDDDDLSDIENEDMVEYLELWKLVEVLYAAWNSGEERPLRMTELAFPT